MSGLAIVGAIAVWFGSMFLAAFLMIGLETAIGTEMFSMVARSLLIGLVGVWVSRKVFGL